MTGDLSRVRSAMMAHPWALDESYFDLMVAVIMTRRIDNGIKFTPDQIAAIKGGRPAEEPNGILMTFAMDDTIEGEDLHPTIAALAADNGGGGMAGGQIGVINIFGTIAQHASAVDGTSGPTGTSTERVGMAIDQAVANPAIKAVVLNINSPGGSVYGVQELANKIQVANKSKPIIAQVSGIGASAAYWLGSAAGELVVQPSGEVGSIGVIGQHIDTSGADAKAGIVKTTIAAGKYKAEMAGPLTDEAQSAMQARMGQYYSAFTSSVARGRSLATGNTVPADAVRSGYGQGRLVGAQDALKEGMIDRIGTLDNTLQRLGRSKPAAPVSKNSKLGVLEPSALDFLPLVSDAGMTPVMIKHQDGKDSIIGDWPQKTGISRSLIDNMQFLSGAAGTDRIVFTMENGNAMYQAIGRDRLNPDLLVCALLSSNGSGDAVLTTDSETEAKAKAEAASFRRAKFRQELESLV
jgi:capsid assembly protease